MSALTEFLDESFSVKGRDNKYYLKGKYRTFGWKFSKIFGLSKNLAAFLTQNGIKAGDRIIIKSPNSPQWVAAFTVCIKMGFIIVPVDYKSDFNFEQKIINKVKPEFILYSRENETFKIISNLINNSGTADINKNTSINKSSLTTPEPNSKHSAMF